MQDVATWELANISGTLVQQVYYDAFMVRPNPITPFIVSVQTGNPTWTLCESMSPLSPRTSLESLLLQFQALGWHSMR